MKSNTLITTLKKLFDLLYRGVFIVLGFQLLFIFIITIIGPYLRARRYVPTSHPRVFLDTVSQSAQATEVTQFDEKGRVVKRIVPEGDDFVTYDGQGREINRESVVARQQRGDSIQRALPDSVKQETQALEQTVKQRDDQKIDSILRHDPKAIITRTKHGYSSRGSGGFGTIQIDLPGQVWSGRPGFKSPVYWEQPVEEPSVFVRHNSPELQLQFRYRSLTDFMHLPPVASISFLLSIGLLFGGPLRLLWQFRKLFAGFSAGQYFTTGQVGRIWQIGWTLVWLFLLHTLLCNGRYYWVVQYMQAHNYQVFPPNGIPILWPDNWLLLLSGLTLLALAQVFLHGLQLKQENDLTI